jgi:peptidoglycan hydrolase CwlO-like protein
MTTSASSTITATVANKLVGDHRSDLLLVGLLKSAGIPAVSVNPGWKFGVTTSAPGTLTSVPGKDTTVFTWTPTPVPPTAQETQIANLTTRATSAESINDSLDKQLATANSQITTMTAELATANGKVTSMTSQLATANEQIAALTKQIATVESTLQSTGATGTTAPAPTPAA